MGETCFQRPASCGSHGPRGTACSLGVFPGYPKRGRLSREDPCQRTGCPCCGSPAQARPRRAQVQPRSAVPVPNGRCAKCRRNRHGSPPHRHPMRSVNLSRSHCCGFLELGVGSLAGVLRNFGVVKHGPKLIFGPARTDRGYRISTPISVARSEAKDASQFIARIDRARHFDRFLGTNDVQAAILQRSRRANAQPFQPGGRTYAIRFVDQVGHLGGPRPRSYFGACGDEARGSGGADLVVGLKPLAQMREASEPKEDGLSCSQQQAEVGDGLVACGKPLDRPHRFDGLSDQAFERSAGKNAIRIALDENPGRPAG